MLFRSYKIDGVPTIAIDGKYETSPSIVGSAMGQQPESAVASAALQVMDALVVKAQGEHKNAAVVPAKQPAPVKEIVKKK